MTVKFQNLPEDCMCGGERLAPVSNVPGVGPLPELITYQCPACGHVETIEKQAPSPKPGGAG
jgi:rubredoxin